MTTLIFSTEKRKQILYIYWDVVIDDMRTTKFINKEL